MSPASTDYNRRHIILGVWSIRRGSGDCKSRTDAHHTWLNIYVHSSIQDRALDQSERWPYPLARQGWTDCAGMDLNFWWSCGCNHRPSYHPLIGHPGHPGHRQAGNPAFMGASSNRGYGVVRSSQPHYPTPTSIISSVCIPPSFWSGVQTLWGYAHHLPIRRIHPRRSSSLQKSWMAARGVDVTFPALPFNIRQNRGDTHRQESYAEDQWSNCLWFRPNLCVGAWVSEWCLHGRAWSWWAL